MDKPVRILVGFAPGGTADLIARVVADKLKDTIGQPVLVENRPGAAGRIAADAVKTAAPDGSTIMVMPIGPMAVVPHTLKAISVRSGEGLHGDRPRRDVPVRAGGRTGEPCEDVGRIRGVGQGESGESIVRDVGGRAACRISSACCCRAISASTWCTSRTRVPAAYMNDLVGGQVPSAIDTVADLSEQYRAGKIRILATTGATRAPATPDVPTFSELGLKNVVASGWFGFFAPANTPKAVIDTLNRGINKALTSPDIVERLTKLGMDPATSTPEEFARIVASDYAKWGPIVKASGFTAD